MRDTEIQENTNRKLFRESQGPGGGVGLGGEADRQTDRQTEVKEVKTIPVKEGHG